MAQDIVISKDAALPKAWRRKIGRWVLWGSAGWLTVATLLFCVARRLGFAELPLAGRVVFGSDGIGKRAVFYGVRIGQTPGRPGPLADFRSHAAMARVSRRVAGRTHRPADISAQDAKAQISDRVLAHRLAARAFGAPYPVVDPLRLRSLGLLPKAICSRRFAAKSRNF